MEIDFCKNLNNTADIVAAGADVIVAGSAVFGGDIAANVKGFHEVFKEGAAKAAWSKLSYKCEQPPIVSLSDRWGFSDRDEG